MHRMPSWRICQLIDELIHRNRQELVGKHVASSALEVQMRACEYTASFEHEEIRPQLFEHMPALDEATYSGCIPFHVPLLSLLHSSPGSFRRTSAAFGVSLWELRILLIPLRRSRLVASLSLTDHGLSPFVVVYSTPETWGMPTWRMRRRRPWRR